MPQTYQVTCHLCHNDKWPYLSAPPPIPYTCALCLGTSPRRRAANQANGQRRAAKQALGGYLFAPRRRL